MQSSFRAAMAVGVVAFALPYGATAEQGTLTLAPDGAWARSLNESQLGDMRGGFGGFAFSVFASGRSENLKAVEGGVSVDGEMANGAPQAEVDQRDDGVDIRTQIGEFQGANGIFQINQVPGDFNIVKNDLFIQINLFADGNLPEVFGANFVSPDLQP